MVAVIYPVTRMFFAAHLLERNVIESIGAKPCSLVFSKGLFKWGLAHSTSCITQTS
jgi:hypothetical protein